MTVESSAATLINPVNKGVRARMCVCVCVCVYTYIFMYVLSPSAAGPYRHLQL